MLWAQDEARAASRAYNLRFTGTTVIIDRQGRESYRDEAATSYEKLKQEVERVI